MPMIRTLATAASLLALASAALVTPAAIGQVGVSGQTKQVTVEAREPKLILVKLHADWCPYCKALEKPWAAAKEELVADDILFVRLNRSDKAQSRQAAFHLAALGLEDAWKEYGNKTGLMVLFDTATGQAVEVFNGRSAGDSVTEAIRDHL